MKTRPSFLNLRLLTLTTLVLTVSSAIISAPETPVREPVNKELRGMQGTWTVSYSEQNGEKRLDVEEVKKMRLIIKDDKWTLEYNNNVKDKRVATLMLNPTQEPKAVDFTFIEGLPAGVTTLAIYELEGDDLKFCFPGESRERPKSFDSRAGRDGQWLLVLKREK